MPTDRHERHGSHANASVLGWLLASDPAIRWHVLSDLTDAPPDIATAERSKVAAAGWGALVLAAQEPDGHWAGFLRLCGRRRGCHKANQPSSETVYVNSSQGKKYGDG